MRGLCSTANTPRSLNAFAKQKSGSRLHAFEILALARIEIKASKWMTALLSTN
jgi:hypothetical protein